MTIARCYAKSPSGERSSTASATRADLRSMPCRRCTQRHCRGCIGGRRWRLQGNNVTLNALPESSAQWIEGDVFQVLRKLRDQARPVRLDRLGSAEIRATAAMAERAARGYKDINLLALKLLRPGGLLLTFSCSGGVSRELVPEDCRRCRAGCGRGRADPPLAIGCARSPGCVGVPGGRVSQGSAVPRIGLTYG